MLYFPLILLGLAPLQDKNVTFVAPAAPCSRLLPELGKKLGIALESGASTREDVVYIHVKDAPASELMKRISTTLNADWVPMNGGFRLVRSTDAVRQEQKRETQETYDHYAKLLAKYKEKAQPDVQFSPEKAKGLAMQFVNLAKGAADKKSIPALQRKLRNQIPSALGLQRLVLTFTPAQLVELLQEKYVTYSSLPTKMQRPFTPTMSRIVDRMAAEQKAWSSAALQQNLDPKVAGLGSISDWSDFDKPDKNPPKVLLSVTSGDGGVSFHLVIGKQGERLMLSNMASLGYEEGKTTTKPPHGAKMKFPEEWKSLNQSRRPTLTKELEARFVWPEKTIRSLSLRIQSYLR